MWDGTQRDAGTLLMSHSISTVRHSQLDNELRALCQEQHSPSSAIIHATLYIGQRTEIGYGDIYTLIPRADNAYMATQAATEMEARCPYLLAAIRDAIAANKPRCTVEVLHDPQGHRLNSPHLSAHERLQQLPGLVQWLLGAPHTVSKDSPS